MNALQPKAETVTFTTTTTVEIADADGVPIFKGSVLREIESGESGVVCHVVKAGERLQCVLTPQVGDLHIILSPGCTRVTNRYKRWRHVPREEQTYSQRFLSWFHTDGSDDYASESLSQAEQEAITGILALMPDDGLDSPFADWPDSISGALEMLAEHFTDVVAKKGGSK